VGRIRVGEPAELAECLPIALSAVAASFARNELAYLALTSKAELPIRDRLAWRLQEALGEAYVVSREWRRADIAVLRRDVPLLQIEAKAMYAFDVLSTTSRAKYLAKLTSDGLKMAALAPNSAAYLLALITYVDGPTATHLRKHVVKYSGGIRAAIAKEGSPAAVMARARSLWEADLERFTSPFVRLALDGGVMWEMHVEIDAFVIGPLTPMSPAGLH
jgi:hypothetical protein